MVRASNRNSHFVFHNAYTNYNNRSFDSISDDEMIRTLFENVLTDGQLPKEKTRYEWLLLNVSTFQLGTFCLPSLIIFFFKYCKRDMVGMAWLWEQRWRFEGNMASREKTREVARGMPPTWGATDHTSHRPLQVHELVSMQSDRSQAFVLLWVEYGRQFGSSSVCIFVVVSSRELDKEPWRIRRTKAATTWTHIRHKSVHEASTR